VSSMGCHTEMVVLRRALITGIDGFTGYYLKHEFEAAGWEVWGTGMAELPAEPKYRRIDLADVAGLTALADELRPDAVVHLAAISFIGHGDPGAFYRVNLIGTRNLLAALAAAGKRPDCVLLPSSANVYGNAVAGMLDENTSPNPASDYAVSKLAMEYMARLWMDRLPIVIVRPFNYTGIGQTPQFLIPKIVDHFRHRAPVIELGNIDVERDFSDVRFVTRAYCELLRHAPAGQVFNICSGNVYSLKRILAMMAEIAGYEIQVRVNPAFVRANEVQRLEGDPGKLMAVAKELPRISLEETLRWMYAIGI